MTQTMTRPTLPGEPAPMSEPNAIAHVQSILAAHELTCWSNGRDFNPEDWSELSPQAIELLEEQGYTREDCSSDAVDDTIWQFHRSEPLSVQVRSSWYNFGEEPTDPDEFMILISCGGPNCYIRGEYGAHGMPDEDSIRVMHSWSSQEFSLPLSDAERYAIREFATNVAS